jgi:aryl-alcohol dehydrogenase-like predicted oxidoreductase
MQARITPEGQRAADGLAQLADALDLTAMQLALLWCKDQAGITAPIVGPRTVGQIEEALVVLDRELDDATRAACDELVPPGNAVADFHNTSMWAKPLRLAASST